MTYNDYRKNVIFKIVMMIIGHIAVGLLAFYTATFSVWSIIPWAILVVVIDIEEIVFYNCGNLNYEYHQMMKKFHEEES